MFLTFLWDINLEIGQSVRSIKENWQEAAKDITVATALIESRTLTGNPVLLETVKTLIDKKKIWKPKDFFEAKREEQIIRHSKQDDIESALSPISRNHQAACAISRILAGFQNAILVPRTFTTWSNANSLSRESTKTWSWAEIFSGNFATACT